MSSGSPWEECTWPRPRRRLHLASRKCALRVVLPGLDTARGRPFRCRHLALRRHTAVNQTVGIVPSANLKPGNPFTFSVSLVMWLTAMCLWSTAGYFLLWMPSVNGVARRGRNKQSGRCRRDLIERHMFLRVREVPAVRKPNFPVIQTSQTQELLSGDLRIIGND